MTDKVDIKLRKNADGIYDINIGADGDLEATTGLDTAFLLSFFAERRASPEEVPVPFLRRGWWGNAFTAPLDHEIGSKLWLLYTASASAETATRAADYTRQAFQWFVTDNLFRRLDVTAEHTFDTVKINITLTNQGNNIETKHFDLLNQTVLELATDAP